MTGLKCYQCKSPTDCENQANLDLKICDNAMACYTSWEIDNTNGPAYKMFERGCLYRIREERFTNKIFEKCDKINQDGIKNEEHCFRKCYNENFCNSLDNVIE